MRAGREGCLVVEAVIVCCEQLFYQGTDVYFGIAQCAVMAVAAHRPSHRLQRGHLGSRTRCRQLCHTSSGTPSAPA